MIDLHCHYLPGIDDGAQTLQEGLALAKAAVADGISAAAMTPHVHPGRYENSASTIVQAVTEFRRALAAAGIPLAIYPAGEVRLCSEIMDMVEADELPYLGALEGYRIVLLEFPHNHIPVGSDKLVRWLLQHNVRPMIAHPERNKEIMQTPGKLQPFVAMGCLLQVTAASVIGHFGMAAQACVSELLTRDWVTVIATDSHNLENRPPVMSLARQYLTQQGAESLAIRLMQTMPGKILGSP